MDLPNASQGRPRSTNALASSSAAQHVTATELDSHMEPFVPPPRIQSSFLANKRESSRGARLSIVVGNHNSKAQSHPAISSPSSRSYNPQLFPNQSNERSPCRSSVGSTATKSSHASSYIAFPSPVRILHSDPEKGRIMDPRAASDTSSVSLDDDQPRVVDSMGQSELQKDCFRLLFYLAGPNVIVSFAILGLSLFSAALVLVLAPFAIISGMKSFQEQAGSLLASPLKVQLYLIRAKISSESYSVPRLLLTNLFSPFPAIAVAFLSWISSVFWVYTLILGDPTGTDKPKDDDGKASVLWVRRQWKRYLSYPIR